LVGGEMIWIPAFIRNMALVEKFLREIIFLVKIRVIQLRHYFMFESSNSDILRLKKRVY
jgi:hypothetical protein